MRMKRVNDGEGSPSACIYPELFLKDSFNVIHAFVSQNLTLLFFLSHPEGSKKLFKT